MSYQMLMSLTQEIMLLDIYMYKIHVRVLSPDIQKSIVQYILLSGESESLLSAKNIYFNVQPCRFCVVISFFHPRHNGQWPPTSKDFYTRSYPWHYFLVYKGTTGTIFITSLEWGGPWLGIEPGPPAAEASTLPLGYRGGGTCFVISFLI